MGKLFVDTLQNSIKFEYLFLYAWTKFFRKAATPLSQLIFRF